MATGISRRRFLTVTAATLGTILAAGCGAAATPTPTPAPAKPAAPAAAAAQPTAVPASTAKVNLQFMWWPVGGDRGLKAMEAALTPFDQANPNITVERIPVAQNYQDKIVTMIAGGTPPDVFAADNYYYCELASKGACMELGPIIEKDGAFKLDVFFAAAQAEGMYKGKRYALPYIGSTRIMFFNSDLMQKKGLDTPDKLWEKGTWTWDKFLEYAIALTDRSSGAANTVYGFNDDRTFGAGGLTPWVWGTKGELLNADMTKCVLNQDAAVAGLKYVQDMVWKSQVMPKADAMKDIDLVATGRIAMWMSWRGLSVGYRAYPYKWDVVPFPVSPAGKMTMYKGNSMCIAAPTKNKDQAWLLAKHITGPVADQAYIMNGGATPRKDNLDTMMKSTPPVNNQYFYNPLNEGWAKQLPLTPKWTQWTTESNAAMDKVFLDNTDPKKVMDELVPAIDKILASA
jgi:multiple sugar transport system substrate-binding protein